MTNTLHRWSEHYAARGAQAVPIQDDFIVFAMATRDVNDDDLAEKYRAFAKLALKHNPVNVGDGTKGGLYRPQRGLTPLVHWRRDQSPDPDRLIGDIDGFTTMAAVFRTFEDMEGLVSDLKEADLGVSVNISAPMDEARRCCRNAGISPHSVEYSLGFMGRMDRLPDSRVLEIGTMCGHGMISHNLVRKLMDWVREGRRTSGEASRYLARFCICGVFNLSRAEKIFEQVKTGTP